MRCQPKKYFCLLFVFIFAAVTAHSTIFITNEAYANNAQLPSGAGGALRLNQPVVGMAAMPDGKGYWLVARDGGIFSYGNAGFYGSTGGFRLNQPIVGMAATPNGRGYWLVASDGGIFSFGNAQFYGSTGSFRLNRPIVGMASTPSGRGYWLVASDGGIFSFGDARFYGSTGSMRLNRPIVGMAPTPSGRGYWLVASDGGIFSFGDARFYGSTGSMRLLKPIVGMSPTKNGRGYWLVAADGGVFSFGNAEFYGSTGGGCLGSNTVAMSSNYGFTGYFTATQNAQVRAFSPTSKVNCNTTLNPPTAPPSTSPPVTSPPSISPPHSSSIPGTVGPTSTNLTPLNGLTITQNNAVIEGVDVTGQITVRANNVTIRNFKANNVYKDPGYEGLLLEDGEIHGKQNSRANGVVWSHYTARRLNVYGVDDAFKAHGSVLIENCWVHDLAFEYNNGNWTHNDGVQVSSGSNVTVRNSRFERIQGTAAIFIKPDQGNISNVTIENNILGGGAYTLYSQRKNGYSNPTNIRILNNIFLDEHIYGHMYIDNPNTFTSGNKTQSGQPVF